MNRFGAWKWLVVVLFLLIPLMGFSQERFYARTDVREILPNSFFEVEFVMENINGTDFSPPDFSPFTVVSGPSTSTQMSIINGRRSQKKSYGYRLLARQPGTFTIGPATIRYKRKTLQTEPLEIKVVERRSSGGEQKAEDVFVRAEVSDTVVYPGQQIVLNYVLYTTKRVSNYNYLSNPNYEGFYTQEIEARDQPERRVIDGREYQVQVFQSIALFPQKLGDLYLQPVQFSLGIGQRNDPFNLFNQTRQIPVTTNDLWIRVKALPEGAPESFNGAIGKYTMSASINTRQATTDDALSLKITIQGNGLAKFIEAPVVDLGTSFDVYDPKLLDEQVYPTNDDIISRKTFEYLLVPRKEGRQDFQVAFSYFDTDSSKYETLNSEIFSVLIRPGQNNTSNLTPEEILEKYQLRPLMMDTKLYQYRAYFVASPWFYIVVAILFLGIPIMLLYRYFQIKRGKIDPLEWKRKRAAKEATRRLAKAKELVTGSKPQEFYRAISEALEKYIADKFSIHTADLSKENITLQLKEKLVDQDSIEEYLTIQQKCDLALFGGVNAAANEDIYERADQLLRKMLLELEKK